jgi:hypothetical protein
MYEETVERIARMMAEDNGDPQHWGVYATRAMEIVGAVLDRNRYITSQIHHINEIAMKFSGGEW